MIQVLIVSKVRLLSSTVLISEDLNISHSRVFGREFRRMNAKTFESTANFMAVRCDSEVRSVVMCSETPELPSQAILNSCWKM